MLFLSICCLAVEAYEPVKLWMHPFSQILHHCFFDWNERYWVRMQKSLNESQKAPADCGEPVNSFRSTIAHFRTCRTYMPYNTFNMNLTMIKIDNLAACMISFLGASSVHISNTGCTRRCFSVALAILGPKAKFPRSWSSKEAIGRVPPQQFISVDFLPSSVARS